MVPRDLWERVAQRLRRANFPPPNAGAAAVVVCAAAAVLLRAIQLRKAARQGLARPILPIALSAVYKLLGEQRIQELVYTDGGALLLRLKQEKVDGVIHPGARFVSQLVPGSEVDVFKFVANGSVQSFRYLPKPWGLANVTPVLVPLLFLFVWYRVAKSLISKDEKFPPSSHSKLKSGASVTFADVVCRSKIELEEIVDYLNRPRRYTEAGARLPRGALLVGPTGTGKTLLARAVAGEANCAFLSGSASEFVEVYVGRGAARVRDLFRQARESAPAVLFIDELDALGTRSRGFDGRKANEEYVQTLNQLLTELDGFHGHSDGVVVLAATNRHEAIDTALLRPGRFDRHVFVELPNSEERLQILKIHSAKASMAANVDDSALEAVAAASPGFSGAELANVVNEAIFLALRSRRPSATSQDLLAAVARARNFRQRSESAAAEEGRMAGLSRTLMRAWPTAAAAR